MFQKYLKNETKSKEMSGSIKRSLETPNRFSRNSMFGLNLAVLCWHPKYTSRFSAILGSKKTDFFKTSRNNEKTSPEILSPVMKELEKGSGQN